MISTITVITDFGKSATKYKRQKNDCTVCAVSKAFGLSYEDAHKSLVEVGRRTGKRFRFSAWLVGSSLAKGRFRTLDLSYNTTLLDFCREFKTGKYIVRTERPNHVIPVVNGIIYDKKANRQKQRVCSAWEIS